MSRLTGIATVVIVGLAGVAYAAAPDAQDLTAKVQALKAQLKAQQSQIEKLQASSNDSWLNEQRAEQVKTLIRDVLADADTRASLQGDGLTAGWQDNFFLASEDGKFLLRISGQSQTRWVHSNVDEDTDRTADADFDEEPESTDGFVQRRTKVRFDGHLFDPAFTYAIQMNASHAGGESSDENLDDSHDEDAGVFRLEDAWSAYEFADGWTVKIGQFKAPFMRDELVDSKHQLAVERAFITDLLTVDFTQGAQLSYDGEVEGIPLRAAVMIHDGSRMMNTEYENDVTDFAVAARAEVLLAGTWSQFDDYTSWSGDETGLLIGAAVDYESPEDHAGDTAWYEVLKWTVDASLELPELNGLNATVAVVGQHLDAQTTPTGPGTGFPDADQIAFLAQAGIFIIPDEWDVFIRYEYIDQDGLVFYNFDNFGADQFISEYFSDEEDELNILTFGTNYYFQKHAAKLSADLVWVMDPLPVNDTGAGLTKQTELHEDDEQFAVRVQFQFLF